MTRGASPNCHLRRVGAALAVRAWLVVDKSFVVLEALVVAAWALALSGGLGGLGAIHSTNSPRGVHLRGLLERGLSLAFGVGLIGLPTYK